jgi:hypothetical protein
MSWVKMAELGDAVLSFSFVSLMSFMDESNGSHPVDVLGYRSRTKWRLRKVVYRPSKSVHICSNGE